MPTKRLADKKLKEYKDILLREREETVDLIRKTEEMQKQESDENTYAMHQADLGSDTDSLEKEVYLMEAEREKLKQINKALLRIEDKTFGICEKCNDLIAEPRLKIVPYANLCIKCKSAEEKVKQVRLQSLPTFEE
jgi:DnaK suppressor protein